MEIVFHFLDLVIAIAIVLFSHTLQILSSRLVLFIIFAELIVLGNRTMICKAMATAMFLTLDQELAIEMIITANFLYIDLFYLENDLL